MTTSLEEDAQTLLAKHLPVEHDAPLAQPEAPIERNEHVGALAAELLLHVPPVLQQQEVAAGDHGAAIAMRVDDLHEVAQPRRRLLDPRLLAFELGHAGLQQLEVLVVVAQLVFARDEAVQRRGGHGHAVRNRRVHRLEPIAVAAVLQEQNLGADRRLRAPAIARGSALRRSWRRVRHHGGVVTVERTLVGFRHQHVAAAAGEGRPVAFLRRRLAAEPHAVLEPALAADVAAQRVLHALPDVAVVLLEDAARPERERILAPYGRLELGWQRLVDDAPRVHLDPVDASRVPDAKGAETGAVEERHVREDRADADRHERTGRLAVLGDEL